MKNVITCSLLFCSHMGECYARAGNVSVRVRTSTCVRATFIKYMLHVISTYSVRQNKCKNTHGVQDILAAWYPTSLPVSGSKSDILALSVSQMTMLPLGHTATDLGHSKSARSTVFSLPLASKM